MTDMDTDEKAKEIEFYAANVNAWFNTRFEHDKSLMTLSAGGLGILISFMSSFGIYSPLSLAIFIFSLLSFVVCLIVLIWIFKQNSIYLENIVQNKAEVDSLLGRLDIIAITSFIFGVVFSAMLGILIAINTYQEKEFEMTEKKDNCTSSVPMFDSVNGVNNMRAVETGSDKLSVNGIGGMRPAQSNGESQGSPTTNESTKK